MSMVSFLSKHLSTSIDWHCCISAHWHSPDDYIRRVFSLFALAIS